MLCKFIQEQRLKYHMTQDYVASKLGMSRPTYTQIENSKRELTISEAKKLAEIFDMILEDFLNEKPSIKPIVQIKKSKKLKFVKKEPTMRISIPQEKADKFEQTLLYILKKIGGKSNIGQTVLYKLLYFIDFDYYEKYETQLIGAKYIKNKYGPTPIIFSKIIHLLESADKIEKIKSKYYKHDQTKYLINPQLEINLSALTSQELAHIDWEIDRLSDMTASQISAFSHRDTPWLVAKNRELLEYEHVFYRTDETSIRQYEQL